MNTGSITSQGLCGTLLSLRNSVAFVAIEAMLLLARIPTPCIAASAPPAVPTTAPVTAGSDLAVRPFRVSTDYPSIQAAIDSLPAKGGTVYIPEGRHVLDRALDLTRRNYHVLLREEEKQAGIASRTSSYVHLMGAGNGTILEGTMKEGPVIDMTDSSFCSISQLQITSKSAQCGILLARPHPKNRKGVLLSCGWHTFYSVNINGSFSVAAVYNQASEVDRWYGCQFGNSHPDSHVFVFAYRNFANIVSPYAGELCEVGSNADQRVNGCLFVHHPTVGADKEHPQGATIYIQGWAEDFSLTDCDFGVGPHTKATIWLDGERNPCKMMHFNNNRFENTGSYLVLATGYTIHIDFTGNTCPGAAYNHIFSTGKAEYWTVSRNMLIHSKTPGTPPMEFANLLHSTIDHNWCDPKPAPGSDAKTPYVRVTGPCEENDIMVPTREDFAGSPSRTKLTALNDAGVRREYVGSAPSGSVLNLTPVDTAAIADPKAGDLALDNGANTKSHKAGLAVFDGKEWEYMN